tara:strand:+ start:287 stop:541 length:255 start_codon:yes stop_codon:yes gene_type:complete
MATDTMQLNFANGWGVSIIDFGYGSDEGLLELAVLKDGHLHYANPVAQGDVCGWLTGDEADKLASEVESWTQDQVFPDWEDEEE